MKISKSYFRGCLLGGAIADARAYGVREGGRNLISDNSQLTTFTVDGLIWADDRARKKGVYAYIPCLFYSYQKWYYTQTGSLADKSYSFILDGEILKWEELYTRRGEGLTSLTALGGSIKNKFGTLQNRINNSMGCGGVMRAAPIGLYFCRNEKMAFKIGCESAALTHGHISGILPAGFIACLISGILQGGRIYDVAMNAMGELSAYPGYEPCYEKLKKAIILAGKEEISDEEGMKELGKGLTGDEAMALSLFLALRYESDYEGAIQIAASYDGNANSIASMCGSILGANLGSLELPFHLIRDLELSELFVFGADRLLRAVTGEEQEKE